MTRRSKDKSSCDTSWRGTTTCAASLRLIALIEEAAVIGPDPPASRRADRDPRAESRTQQHGFATLLIDLLTEEEEETDSRTGHLRFDIDLLAGRLVAIVDWLRRRQKTEALPIGLFGASTGGDAALVRQPPGHAKLPRWCRAEDARISPVRRCRV